MRYPRLEHRTQALSISRFESQDIQHDRQVIIIFGIDAGYTKGLHELTQLTGIDLIQGHIERNKLLDQTTIFDAIIGLQPGMTNEQDLYQPADRLSPSTSR